MADEVKTTPETKGPTHEKARALVDAIEAGKHEVPADPAPLVCKPTRIESWRVFKIMSEFVDGFELIGKYGLAATFFGSERTGEGAPMYEAARALSGALAKKGFAIITGGAQGIMQAANQGAFEAGGQSVGLNIRLAAKQAFNKYLTDSAWFDHFFVRKVMLTYSSDVYIYFPGGFGTLDEFFEIVTLIQTAKIKRLPIVLYGKEYWTPILELFQKELCDKYATISQNEMDLFKVVDSLDEAYDYIVKNVTC
ncbi:MAG TPA: TIGR00730 family Rossman fold protein [Candidatus Paceibacterota bacterium]